ncbi:MAG: hypothetical protein ABW321_12770 [Polyangiales bacterium]
MRQTLGATANGARGAARLARLRPLGFRVAFHDIGAGCLGVDDSLGTARDVRESRLVYGAVDGLASACLGLLLGVSVLLVVAADLAHAQSAAEPPPVPPATEAAERAREAADRARDAADRAREAADQAAVAADAADGGGGARSVRSSSSTSVRPLGHPWEAPSGTRGPMGPPGSDPLDAFPPAPSPLQNGTIPARGASRPRTTTPLSTSTSTSTSTSATGTTPNTAATDEETTSAAAATHVPPPVPPSPLERLPPADEPAEPRDTNPPAAFSGSASPTDEPLYRVNALVGIGVTFDNIVGGVNPLGFGFGFLGDYHLLERYRVGGRILYYVGGSSELPTGYVSLQSWLIAAEASYVFDELSPLRIEPGVAVGLHIRDLEDRPIFTSPSQGFVAAREGSDGVGLYLAPGVRLVLPLSVISADLAMVHVGIDARLDLVLGPEVTGNLELLLLTGVTF